MHPRRPLLVALALCSSLSAAALAADARADFVEGTRSRTRQWKAGFHHIARGAGLPILQSYLDWGTRTCGLGPLVDPSDDVEGDIARIRAFYAPFRGRNADQFDSG